MNEQKTEIKRVDQFARFFQPQGGFIRSRPLAVEKLVDSEWVKMADLAESDVPEYAANPDRLADALGGEVRLVRAGMMLAAWRDGECVEDYRGGRGMVA
jgi:hypothetical protein